MLIRFRRDERAATAIEYCLIACLVSVLVVAGARSVGSNLVTNYYGKIVTGFS